MNGDGVLYSNYVGRHENGGYPRDSIEEYDDHYNMEEVYNRDDMEEGSNHSIDRHGDISNSITMWIEKFDIADGNEDLDGDLINMLDDSD